MKWTFDADADAAYLTLHEAPVARTIELAPNVMLDIAENGLVLGVEILTASHTGLTPSVVGLTSF